VYYGHNYLKTLGFDRVKDYQTTIYGLAPPRKAVTCSDGANCDDKNKPGTNDGDDDNKH
jgi:hypothetical protein